MKTTDFLADNIYNVEIIGGSVGISPELNMEQAAEYLKLDLNSFESIVKKGIIPYYKKNDEIIFRESVLSYYYRTYFLPVCLLSDDISDLLFDLERNT
jgi:hypothetical protein